MNLLLKQIEESNCSKLITNRPLILPGGQVYIQEVLKLTHRWTQTGYCLSKEGYPKLMLKLSQWLLQGLEGPHQIKIYIYSSLDAEALRMALSQQLSHFLCVFIVSWRVDKSGMSLNLLRLASFRERKCNSQFYCDWGSFMPELGFFADAHITTISFLECLIVLHSTDSNGITLFQMSTIIHIISKLHCWWWEGG